MDQNNTNPNTNANGGASQSPGDNQGDTLSDASSELLFEATEAFIRALSIQNPTGGEQAAIDHAVNSEALAPFDGPVVMQAVGFLRRMGFLSPEARKAA